MTDQTTRGLYNRYEVRKRNGSGVDPSAEYFVLRLDSGGRDPVHVAACRAAVLVYADKIEAHIPQLAADLRMRYGPIDD